MSLGSVCGFYGCKVKGQQMPIEPTLNSEPYSFLPKLMALDPEDTKDPHSKGPRNL